VLDEPDASKTLGPGGPPGAFPIIKNASGATWIILQRVIGLYLTAQVEKFLNDFLAKIGFIIIESAADF